MKLFIKAICGITILTTSSFAEEERQLPKILKHETRTIAGWKVHVDQELIHGTDTELGKTALRLLDDKLFEITLRLPPERIQQLQQVNIWLDAQHELTSMQYHPGAGWLKDHGYDPKMVKGVHIPRAQRFIDHITLYRQPWALMHELAHAYHDQFLGWDHAGIRQNFEEIVASEMLKQVKHITGSNREHYALTNPKEFFAEMTESYLGTNDFYPFVRGELRDSFPETYALMQSIWVVK